MKKNQLYINNHILSRRFVSPVWTTNLLYRRNSWATDDRRKICPLSPPLNPWLKQRAYTSHVRYWQLTSQTQSHCELWPRSVAAIKRGTSCSSVQRHWLNTVKIPSPPGLWFLKKRDEMRATGPGCTWRHFPSHPRSLLNWDRGGLNHCGVIVELIDVTWFISAPGCCSNKLHFWSHMRPRVDGC